MASNPLKIGKAVQLESLATVNAPATVAGTIYFDSTDGVFKKCEDGATFTDFSAGGGPVDLTSDVTGVLPVANGGTNSATTLNNNRVIKSSGGALVEAAAITAARALISDANGIPTQSATTSTELGYVSGVTSAIQTQIDSKVAKAGDALTGDLTFSTTKGIQNTSSASTLNIGTSGNSSTINIGASGSTVNILGSLTYVETTQTQVTDPLITLNKGGAAGSGGGSGFEVEENSSITGYVKTSAARTGFDLKSPATAGVATVRPNSTSHIYDLPNADGTLLTAVSQDTAPQLGGALDVNGNAVESLSNGNIVIAPNGTGRVRYAKQGALSRYVDQQYIDAITLTASTTAVASALTFDSTAYKGQIVQYIVSEATTFKRKIGQLLVTCDGDVGSAATTAVVVDLGTETADVGISWSAAMNSNNVELSYTTTANAKSMQVLSMRML